MGAQVFTKPGEFYAIYLPTAVRSGRIDLSEASGDLSLRWYNPRTGSFEGNATSVRGNQDAPLGSPPSDLEQDWVVLIKAVREAQ
jgi:hypothetical protein